MYRLYGFFTQNTMKALYTIEEIGVDYEFKFIDLMKGEQREEAFQKIAPIGKVPLFQHDDKFLFESSTICRYIANVENSNLYPSDKFKRAEVEQWMDFFTNHLGRWLNTMFFENIIKVKAQIGEPDQIKITEAKKFIEQQFGMIEKILSQTEYLAGNELSIADLSSFAYVEQIEAFDMNLNGFEKLTTWYNKMKSLESVTRAKKKLEN